MNLLLSQAPPILKKTPELTSGLFENNSCIQYMLSTKMDAANGKLVATLEG